MVQNCSECAKPIGHGMNLPFLSISLGIIAIPAMVQKYWAWFMGLALPNARYHYDFRHRTLYTWTTGDSWRITFRNWGFGMIWEEAGSLSIRVSTGMVENDILRLPRWVEIHVQVTEHVQLKHIISYCRVCLKIRYSQIQWMTIMFNYSFFLFKWALGSIWGYPPFSDMPGECMMKSNYSNYWLSIYDCPWKPEGVQTLKLMAPARPLGARVPGLIPGTTKRVSSAEGAAVGIADISPMQLCWIISPRCCGDGLVSSFLHSFEGWYWWYWCIVFSHTGAYTQYHPISSRIHARCMRSDGPGMSKGFLWVPAPKSGPSK